MKTDALLYALFQNFPALFFEVIGEDPQKATDYHFRAVEVKQTAFRLDGVLLPTDPTAPIYFLECQFQKDPTFYLRLFGQIGLYCRRENYLGDWQAVVLFARRSLDPGVPIAYRAFEQSRQIQRFYLKEQAEQGSVALGVLNLVGTSKRSIKTKVQALLPRITTEGLDVDRQRQIMEIMETVVVAKFPQMSRQELEAMLGLESLRNTRVFQEGREAGIEQGREAGIEQGREVEARSLIERQLTRRLGNLTPQDHAQVRRLSLIQLEQLGEDLLDFRTPEDLLAWLDHNA